MMYSYQPQNNAVLTGTVKPMPLKDSTSDGTGSFAISRHEYAETNAPIKKKWFNSNNRDASDIAINRRVQEIGVGTFNAGAGDFAFMNKNDNNSRVDALARVRGGGYVVSKKVRNRPSSDGVPMSSLPKNSPVIRTDNRRAMVPTYRAV